MVASRIDWIVSLDFKRAYGSIIEIEGLVFRFASRRTEHRKDHFRVDKEKPLTKQMRGP